MPDFKLYKIRYLVTKIVCYEKQQAQSSLAKVGKADPDQNNLCVDKNIKIIVKILNSFYVNN